MSETPKRVDKPWGYEIWWARTERYVGKILHVNKGESLSLQYHNVKDETIMVQSGRLLFQTRPAGEEGELRDVEMKPGDVFHITPGTLHRMTALEDCDIVEVSTPELDDVVRLEDRYGRAGHVEALVPLEVADRRGDVRDLRQDRVLEHGGVADERVERADAPHRARRGARTARPRCGPRSRRRSPRSGESSWATMTRAGLAHAGRDRLPVVRGERAQVDDLGRDALGLQPGARPPASAAPARRRSRS